MKKFTVISLFLSFFTSSAFPQNSGTGLKQYGLKGKVKQVIEYVYASKTETADTVHIPGKLTRTFNEEGNEIEEHMINPNSTSAGRAVYNYVPVRTVVVNHFNGKDSLISQLVDKYNKEGLRIERIIKYGVKGDVLQYKFSYDRKGRRVEQDSYENDQLKTKIIGLYNDNNQLIEDDLYDPDGKLRRKTKRNRDTSKNTLVEEIYDVKDVLQTRNSSADSMPDKQGNWQRTLEISEGHDKSGTSVKQQIIIKREFVYY